MPRFLALVALIFAFPVHAAPTFVPLGNLGGDFVSSGAFGVSADGSTVVGLSITSGGSGSAFRWTSQEGMVELDPLPGQYVGQAFGVSADGSTIVGYANRETGVDEAFRWTSAEGTFGLGFLPDMDNSLALAISADGSTIVGGSMGGSPQSAGEAFRWTSADGMVGLGHLPGDGYSSAGGVSADGSVIVGTSAIDRSTGAEAFRWTDEDGMVGLGQLPGDIYSGADAISADGSTIAGFSSSRPGDNQQAVLWVSGGGILPLGFLPGFGVSSYALALSADGSIVVGESYGPSGSAAFLWDETYGTRSLQQVLTALGMDLTGWELTNARGISADGHTIVGFGTNPSGATEAFLAFSELWPVPEPGTALLVMAGLLGLAGGARNRTRCGRRIGPH